MQKAKAHSADTIRERVKFVLDHIPGAETDDRVLYLAYIHLYVHELPRDLFRRLATDSQGTPHIESVLRRRREIIRDAKIKQIQSISRG